MGKESKMPCFSYGVLQATNSLRQRFQLQMSADEAEQFVETDLIGKSLGSYYTRLFVYLNPIPMTICWQNIVMIHSNTERKVYTNARTSNSWCISTALDYRWHLREPWMVLEACSRFVTNEYGCRYWCCKAHWCPQYSVAGTHHIIYCNLIRVILKATQIISYVGMRKYS